MGERELQYNHVHVSYNYLMSASGDVFVLDGYLVSVGIMTVGRLVIVAVMELVLMVSCPPGILFTFLYTFCD